MSTSEKILIAVLGFIALSATAFSRDSLANPENSSGAGRTVESSSSDKISRDESLSQDKSTGNKATSSSSRESSQERSKETKTSKGSKLEQSQKKDISIKLNANPLFISEWIGIFENGDRRLDMDMQEQMKSAKTFFSVCRPLTGIDSTFPVLQGKSSPSKYVIGEKSLVASLENKAYWNAVLDGAPVPPHDEDLERGNLVSYIVCRQMAHVVMSETAKAIEEVIQDGRVKVSSEQDLRALIRKGFEIAAENRDLWNMALVFSFKSPGNRVRQCNPFLSYFWNAKGHDMDCGNFRVQGDTVYINGVPTLSNEAINGRKFELALSNSGNASETDSTDASESTKVSNSRKTSSSRESYADSKKTAGMKVSKASDNSSSSKISRDAKADVKASPQQ